MIKVPLHTLSVLGVPSQPKMSNLDCWGQGESKDTHMVGVVLKGIATSCTPSVSSLSLGLKWAHNVKCMALHWPSNFWDLLDLSFLYPYCWVRSFTLQNGTLEKCFLDLILSKKLPKYLNSPIFMSMTLSLTAKIVWNFVSLHLWHFMSCKNLYDTLHHFTSMTQNVWHKKYGLFS